MTKWLSKRLKTIEISANLTKEIFGKNVDFLYKKVDQQLGRRNQIIPFTRVQETIDEVLRVAPLGTRQQFEKGSAIAEVFEEIREKTGYTEGEVIKIMRRSLNPSSFKLWRKRVSSKSIKHRKKFEQIRRKLKEKINKNHF